MTSRHDEMKERQALVGSTNAVTCMRDAAIANIALDSQGRRHNADVTVVGSRAGPIYPPLPPNSPWSSDPVGQEPPLGYRIHDTEPVGEAFEIEASAALELARASASSSSGVGATTDDGSSPSGGGEVAASSTEGAATSFKLRRI
jgi:hypothetical protein